jgi:hypothetical protein
MAPVRTGRRGARGAAGAIAVCALLIAAPAAAAPTWVPKSTVPLDSGHAAHGVSVGMDAAGNVAMLFNVEISTGTPTDQSVEQVDRPAGGAFGNFTDLAGGPIPASTMGNFDGRLAVDPAGNAAAAWSYAAPVTGQPDIHVIRVRTRPAGGAWGTAVDVSPPGAPADEAAEFPSIVLGGSGNPTVAWEDFLFPPGGAIHVATRLSGDTWSNPQRVNPVPSTTDPYSGGDAPMVAANARGDRVVVWHGVAGDGDEAPEIASSAAGSTTFGTQHQISILAGPNFISAPQVGLDGTGTATAAWVDGLGGAGTQVETTSVPIGGTAATTKVISGTDVVADQGLGFATDAAGDAVALWATTTQIRAAYRPVGGSFGTPQTVYGQATAFNLGFHVLNAAMNSHGDVVATWSLSTSPNIVFVANHPGGAGWSSATEIASDATNPTPQVAIDGSGNAIVAWSPPAGAASPSHSVETNGFDFSGPALRSLSIPSSGVAGTPVSFSVSPLDVWSGIGSTTWSFGDGATAAGLAVQHTYAGQGTYTVTATSTDGNGNATTSTHAIAVAPAPPPTAVTGSATHLGQTSATISATVNPLGQQTTYHFDWGATTAYGHTAPVPDAAAGADNTEHVVSTTLTGLRAHATYHYRVVASYCGGCPFGTTTGSDGTFTTASPPLLPATITWGFAPGRKFSVVVEMTLHNLPSHTSVEIICKGGGCPSTFSLSNAYRAKVKTCTKKHKCTTKHLTRYHATLGIVSRLAHRHLQVGDHLTVRVTAPGTTGRVFEFVIRRSQAPSFKIECLLPGDSAPSACS